MTNPLFEIIRLYGLYIYIYIYIYKDVKVDIDRLIDILNCLREIKRSRLILIEIDRYVI